MRLKTVITLMFCACFTQLSLAQKENPNEKLAYLIGTWKLELVHKEMKITAFMDFEWGVNKTYVLSRNTNSRNGGPVEVENTSIISWDGVAETFVISSVYNGPGDLLVGRGTVDVTEKKIFRDILLHYAEGEKIPFINEMAGKGGGKLQYRQHWEKIDANSFRGRMEVLMHDQWKTTFDNEIWRKQK
ncbi:MAG: DUF1579 domain-containing protein [Roseivirga sp.]|nr:DUF1579 domain-containing protein [Roseivirga sp.]